MTYLNYYAHILIHSKYKLILFLTFYIIIIFFYNFNNINYACCEENSINNTTSNNKLLGLGLFLGSIALMLFIQNSGGGSDPSAIIDMTMHLQNQGTLHNVPEFLDYFTFTNNGKLYINDINIDAKNIYLNAETVISQIQLEEKAQNSLKIITEKLKQMYSIYNLPVPEIVFLTPDNLETFMPLHIQHFTNIIFNLGKHVIFIDAIEKAGLINPNYALLFKNYIENGGQPDQFYTFLMSRMQQG